MRKCPFCGADIEDNARFCLYCMQSLVEKEQISLHEKKKPQWFLIIAAIVAILLAFALVQFLKLVSQNTEAAYDEPQLASTVSLSQTNPSEAQNGIDSPHVHSYSVENASAKYLKEAATCRSLAIYYYSCACGEMGSETFSHGDLAEHVVVTDIGYSADCVKNGLTDGSHCAVCNIVLLAQTPIPTVSHTYDGAQDDSCNVCNFIRVLNCNHEKVVSLPAADPTCVAAGLTEGKSCSLCGEILTAQSVIAPFGHTEVRDQAILATCTTDGKTEGKHCATCNAVLSQQITLPAKGHTEVIDQAVAPTCATDGKTEGKHCATCNAVLSQQITLPAKGHTEVIDQAVAPTCTTDGKTEGKHCSVCMVVLVPQQSLAAGHSFSTEDLAAPCSRCGAPSSHTHSYSSVTISDEYLKTKSTCKNAAVYYYSCACGKKGSSTFSWGERGAHTVVIDPAVAPTCDTPGLSEGSHCSVCQLLIKEQFKLLAKGHTFRLDNYPSNCLVCGATETLKFKLPEFPFYYNNTYKIDGGTYTAHEIDDGNWRFVFSFTYTNISSDSVTSRGPALNMSGSFSYTAPLSVTLQPNQSAVFQHAFLVHYVTFTSQNTYELAFAP